MVRHLEPQITDTSSQAVYVSKRLNPERFEIAFNGFGVNVELSGDP
jgi:hypothetical protein